MQVEEKNYFCRIDLYFMQNIFKDFKNIFLVFVTIILTLGCNNNFYQMRYPDLHKVKAEARIQNDSLHPSIVQRMPSKRDQQIIEKVQDLIQMNPLSMLSPFTPNVKSAIVKKALTNSDRIIRKLKMPSRLFMSERIPNGVSGGVGFLIALLSLIAVGVIILLMSAAGPAGRLGCLLSIFISILIIALIFWAVTR
jgi:hypothetical protein